MPDNVYEVVAQGARYWFLFWMALIVWRSWRWYRKDRRAAKKRLRLLPDAGFVGEMVVIDGGGVLDAGTVFPVSREGTLGTLRTNDLCVQAQGVARRHLWFRFDDRKGLMVQPFDKNAVQVDGADFQSRRDPLYMSHDSWLTVGGVQMRLRLFAGFESVGHAQRRADPDMHPQPQAQAFSPEQYAQMQQMMAEQWQMQQQYAYQQGYREAMAQQEQAQMEETYEEPVQEQAGWTYEENPDALPYDMAQIAREEGMVDDSIFMRPKDHPKPELPEQEKEEPVFYAPVMDEEPDAEEWLMDEDATDASAPPRSAYVGEDDAARAKREVWDKYFGGGAKR